MAQELVKEKGVSIRLSCWIFGISEHCYRYCSKQSDDNILIADWLMRLTDNHRNWGFGGVVLNFVYPDFRQETAIFVWRYYEHEAHA